MAVVYDTVVVAVGDEAKLFFEQGIVVLFAEGAPEELAEFSITHRPTVTDAGVVPGAVVDLAGERLSVVSVGDVANDNLRNLGHLILKRNASSDPLPGDVCCDEGRMPELVEGDRMQILVDR